MRTAKSTFIVFILFFALQACTVPASELPATDLPEPTAKPIPITEADVPRVSLKDAKAAIESGEAVVVDVRSLDAFKAGHIPGALSISLSEIETHPASIGLEKEQWIITYCT
jgi:3-mercaptopyruvate sulfurtransferase SseA